MAHRKATTKIVIRKTGYAVKRYGRVVFFDKDMSRVETFLLGFDPDLAAARARQKSAPIRNQA